jgi:hypothetical protein
MSLNLSNLQVGYNWGEEDNIKMDLQEVGGGLWGLDGVGSG